MKESFDMYHRRILTKDDSDKLIIFGEFASKDFKHYGKLYYGNDESIKTDYNHGCCSNFRFVNTGVKTKAISLFGFWEKSDHSVGASIATLSVYLYSPVVRIDQYRMRGKSGKPWLHWVYYESKFMKILNEPVFKEADKATLEYASQKRYYGDGGGDWGPIEGDFCGYEGEPDKLCWHHE